MEGKDSNINQQVESQPQETQSLEQNDQKVEEMAQPAEQETQSQETQSQVETDRAKNFRALRQTKERAEKERDNALIRLQEYERQISERQIAAQHVQEENYDINLGEDELAEGKHLKKVAAHIKKLESQLKNYQQQASNIGTESRLKSQYPDFDDVVCKDNIELLRNTYPEIAQTINSSTDLYSKAVSAYTMIKKLGIQQNDNFQPQKDLAQKNAAKPKPLTSMSPQQGDSPLSYANAFANGLTEDLKKQLYREMIEASKKS